MVVEADFQLKGDDPIIGQLTDLQSVVGTTLQLPATSQPVNVHIFSSSDRFHQYLEHRFPGYPVRRAFFIKHQGRFEVCAQWGEHIVEDLRHEITHAYLHAAVSDPPLWLDEGLAEYFEIPPHTGGWHASHAELLGREYVAGRWRPNLPQLEALSSPADMTQLNYAEAWAWTYLLLNTTPARRELLVHHLNALSENSASQPLGELLYRNEVAPHDALIAMLSRESKMK
jgi:hypothetical protein